MKAFILAILTLSLFVMPTFALEEIHIDPITPTPIPEVNYTLPFPGILPDNPLYALKATRDRLVSFFISSPIKKAEFDLLQADKRLQAGLFLLHEDEPNIPLAISTISKGQNYLEESLHATGEATKQASSGTPSPTGVNAVSVGDLPQKLVAATRKHNELLRKEQKKFTGQDARDFAILLKRSETYMLTAEKLQRSMQ